MDFDQGKWVVLAEDPVAASEPSDSYYSGNNRRQYRAAVSGIFATAGLKFELRFRYKGFNGTCTYGVWKLNVI
jgi:hypothetical protein